MSQEQIDETLHVAMTVGATRMQVMLGQEAARTAATATEPTPTFKAVEVVSQAAGG